MDNVLEYPRGECVWTIASWQHPQWHSSTLKHNFPSDIKNMTAMDSNIKNQVEKLMAKSIELGAKSKEKWQKNSISIFGKSKVKQVHIFHATDMGIWCHWIWTPSCLFQLIKERLWLRRHYTRAHGVARTEAQSITFLISSYYRNSTNNNFSGLDKQQETRDTVV